jgi:membrane protein DedA with SNARE-associated domain
MSASVTEGKEGPAKIKGYLIIISGLVVIGIAALAVAFRGELANFKEYGYLGAFLISLMAAATIIICVPGVPMVLALGGLLPNPIFIGLAAGLGEAIGEFTGYLAGRGGHVFLKRKFARVCSPAEAWVKKRGSLALVPSAAVFDPFFDPIGATAGALRYPVWEFFLLSWVSKTIKGTRVALLGWCGDWVTFSIGLA